MLLAALTPSVAICHVYNFKRHIRFQAGAGANYPALTFLPCVVLMIEWCHKSLSVSLWGCLKNSAICSSTKWHKSTSYWKRLQHQKMLCRADKKVDSCHEHTNVKSTHQVAPGVRMCEYIATTRTNIYIAMTSFLSPHPYILSYFTFPVLVHWNLIRGTMQFTSEPHNKVWASKHLFRLKPYLNKTSK